MKYKFEIMRFSPGLLTCLIIFFAYTLSLSTPLQAKTIRVGIYQNSPKVFVDKNGNPKGIFVDIMNEIAKQEGWKLNYVFGTWSENLERLESFEIDILLDVSYSDNRAALYKFNNVFVIDDWLEAFTLHDQKIKSVIDLHGKRIAVLKGSIQDGLMRNELGGQLNIDYTVTNFIDYPQGVQSLLKRETDVLVASRFFWFSSDRKEDIVSSTIILKPAQVYFAFPKQQNEEIVRAIDRNLAKMKNNSKSVYYKSIKNWLDTSQKDSLTFYLEWALIILSIALIITATIIFFVRRQVSVRTRELSIKNEDYKTVNIQLQQLITNYKKAEQELIKFGFMVENARQEVYLVYPNGKLAYINTIVTSSLGYTKEELLEGGVKLFDPIYGNKFPEHFEDLKSNELPTFETNHFTKGGRKLVKHIKSFYIQIDEQEYVCGFAEDITERKKAEKALFESQKVFETLTNMSPVGIFRTRADGYTTYVNQKWCELSGLTAEEALGDGWLNAVHPDDKNRVLSNWKIHSAKGEHSEAEYRFVKKDGSKIWVLGYAIPEKDGNEIVGYIGTLTDITDRKRGEMLLKRKTEEIEVEVKKYKQLLDLATDAFFHGSSTGHLIMVNRAAIELTGYSKEELLSMNLRELFSEDEIIRKPLRYDLLEQGMILKNERLIVDKNGKSVYVEMNSTKMPDGTYQSFVRDISERKKVELLLQQKADEIAAQNEEYRQLNEELTIAKAKAEQSDKLKSAFLANMSHEIRTPMNAICGFSRLLERNNLAESKRKEYIDIINFNSLNLLGIINDIVDISKIESGLVYLSSVEFNLNLLFDSIYHTLAPTIQSPKVKLALNKSLPNELCIIEGDDLKIKQILVNLLVNAIKFTAQGVIEFGYQLTKQNLIEFYVKDTGIGIPADHLSSIFERFHQVEGANLDSRKGTGLGLAISKGFVELMGGSIWVESELGKGSTFFFTIPFSPTNQKDCPGESEVTTANYNWDNKTILIVEDDEPNLLYLKAALNETGVKLIAVNTAEDAVVKSKEEGIDLILMDIKLPKMNGIEATRLIRELKPELPIIAQTAYVFSSDRENALSAGCNAFITKPIDRIELLDTINKFLG
jgi:PAS domain S-box-containing protein